MKKYNVSINFEMVNMEQFSDEAIAKELHRMIIETLMTRIEQVSYLAVGDCKVTLTSNDELASR
jgi:hypothetical protein